MKESLNLYKILIMVFLCIFVALIHMNFTIMENTYSIQTSSISTNNISETLVKKYGYTDILSMLKEDVNLEIVDIKGELENNNIIAIDIKYNSTLENLNNALEKIKSEPYFLSMKNINIDKTKGDMSNISLTVVFLKNK
jgi:hypothetical protein